MSLYRLSAELPGGDENREKRVEIMAEGFKTALNHAATDPEIRLRMLMGEVYSKWSDILEWLKREIAKESPEVREAAVRSMTNSFMSERADEVVRTQMRFLLRALEPGATEDADDIGP